MRAAQTTASAAEVDGYDGRVDADPDADDVERGFADWLGVGGGAAAAKGADGAGDDDDDADGNGLAVALDGVLLLRRLLRRQRRLRVALARGPKSASLAYDRHPTVTARNSSKTCATMCRCLEDLREWVFQI